MFLKELSIRRYGPLPDSGRVKLAPFSLFYGPNEAGKTLTIDALLKILLGPGAAKAIPSLNRVEGLPDGYLVIENKSGADYVLPDSGVIGDLYPIAADQFARVFVIRDSDLSIPGESGFYRGITEKLTGIRSAEIRAACFNILDQGQITPKGDYQNTAPLKLKERLKSASALVVKIELLSNALAEEGFNSFEEELVRLDQLCHSLAEKRELLLKAASREKYHQGCKALEKLEEAQRELSLLDAYTDSEYYAWQRLETSCEQSRSELKRLEESLARLEVKIDDACRKLSDLKSAHKNAERELEKGKEKLASLLEKYDHADLEKSRKEAALRSPFFKWLLFLSAFFAALFLGGALLQGSWWLYLLFGLSFSAVSLLAWSAIRLLVLQADLGKQQARITQAASELGTSLTGAGQARSFLGRLQKGLENERWRLDEAEQEYSLLQREKEMLEENSRRNREHLDREKDELDRIRGTLRLPSLESLREALEKKNLWERAAEKHLLTLEHNFGGSLVKASREENISHWKEKIDGLESFRDAAPGVIFDEKELDRVSGELQAGEKDHQSLQEKLKGRSEELREIEKEANNILAPYGDQYFPCQTSLDLEALKDLVNLWVEEQEEKRAAALAALEIFEKLAAEEEEKVSSLFGPGSKAGQYFSRATAGKYREIHFKSDQGRVIAIDREGLEQSPEMLSGGAYDQLYFSIRLALGEKILGREKGFLVLDDPFIKADAGRLEKQLQMLIGLCQEGWQILYFSAKDEVKAVLNEKIGQGEIKIFTI